MLASSVFVVRCWAALVDGELRVSAGAGVGLTLGLSTRGPSAFRLRIFCSDGAARFESPMVGPSEADASFQVVHTRGIGIRSAFGSLVVTTRGTVELRRSSGRLLTSSHPMVKGARCKRGRMAGGQLLQLTTAGGLLYGRGASPLDARQLTAKTSEPAVMNRATYTPYYYSTDGYSALGAVNTTMRGSQEVVGHFPTKYVASNDAVSWYFNSSFELYLMPAASLAEGTRAYYELIGKAQVPPRYMFGFIASRWGWESKEYIEEIIGSFRSGHYPIDGIIADFEWFTNESDYAFDAGKPYYHDFAFYNKTFPHPQEQLSAYRTKFHIRVGGIRKPRLGNSDSLQMARERGWLLPNGENGGSFPPNTTNPYAVDRNLDFSQAEVRGWYSNWLAPLVKDGMSFWWNDEGETDYFTYHWWNIAELDAWRSQDESRRFFSLNRAFTPGMARLGAAVWTGDTSVSWEDLQGTPGMMLNFVLGGAPYVACDIGGFVGQTDEVLLTRWMQVGVFMPIMRVHSWIDSIPHFPFLFGQDAALAMKKALELRYKLVPYHYSLAHQQFRTGYPWIRPLVMAFPHDAAAANITLQWMDGEILAAPTVDSQHRRDIYLPTGEWYVFSPSGTASLMMSGGRRIGQESPLDEMPAFVLPGTIIPLAPVVQSTDLLPGGPLEVQVYGGRDAEFVLYEDDGETTAYLSGAVRATHFKWNNAAKCLSWKVSGTLAAAGEHAFKEVVVTLLDQTGIFRSTGSKPLGSHGSITLSDQIIVD